MGAVRGAEGVVHVGVGEVGQGAGELGVVLLLPFIEADVLQQQHIAVFQGVHDFLSRRSDKLAREHDVTAEQLLQTARDGAQAEGLLEALPRRSAAVAREDHPGAVADELVDGGQRRTDARIVSHVAVGVHRRVEVDAHEHLLAREILIVNSLDIRHVVPFPKRKPGSLREPGFSKY